MKPARTVISRAPHREVGSIHAPSFQPDPIHHESDLERGCIEVLLLMPMAKHIRHQPMSLKYEIDGKQREYTPDLQVTLNDGKIAIIEVKPECFVDEYRAMFDICAPKLAAAGIDFFVCTDAWLSEARLARASELRDAGRRNGPPASVAKLTGLVARAGKLQVRDALEAGVDHNVIRHAVGRRLLTVGPDLDVSPVNWLRSMESDDEYVCCGDWLGGPPWGKNMAP